MTDLIDRLRATTAGSRELSNLIWCAAVRGYEISADGNQFCVPKCYCCRGHDDGEPHWQPIVAPDFAPPDYTTSLDAALTLVPEGWTRAVDATAPEMDIDVDLFGPDKKRVMGRHGSEPIATCIAALLARESQP